MAKGYWVGRVDVSNPEAYKNYVAANGAAFSKFGGRFLVRGGAFEAVSGLPQVANPVVVPLLMLRFAQRILCRLGRFSQRFGLDLGHSALGLVGAV